MAFDPSTASQVATAEFDPSTAKPAQAFDESTAQPVAFDPSSAKPVAPAQEDPEEAKHRRVMERLGYKPKQQAAAEAKPDSVPADKLSDTEKRIIRTALTTGANMADAVQTFARKARPTVVRFSPFLSKEEKEQELKRMAEQEIGLSDLITGKKKESQTPTIDLLRNHISEIKVDKSKDDTLKAKATEFVTGVVTSLATPLPALSGGLAMGGAAQQGSKAEGKSQDEAERIGMINSIGGTILNKIPFVGNKAISGIENFFARRAAAGASAAAVNVVGEAAIQGIAEGELSADRLKQAGGIGFGMGLLFGPSFQKKIAGKSREEVEGLIKQELSKMPKDELAQLNKSVADSAKEQGIKLDVTAPDGAPATITPEQAKSDSVRYKEIMDEVHEMQKQAEATGKPIDDARQLALFKESEAIKNRNPESHGMPPGEVAADPIPENISESARQVDFNVREGQLEAVEKVDIGERKPEISDGSGTPTPFEQKMMDEWKAQIQKETPPTIEQPAQTAGAGPIHQYLDKKLSEAGLSPAQRTDALTRDGLMAEASKIIESDPMAGKRVIDDLKERPRAATPQEEALITFEMARVDKARNDAEQRLVEAVKSGNEDLVIRAEAERKKATEEYGRVFDTVGNSVSRSGQALNFAKLLKQSDYTLAGLERRTIAANEGKPLTKEDSAKIAELTKKIEDQQKRYDDYRARMSELLMSEEAVAPVRRLSEYRKRLSSEADKARVRISQRLEKYVTKSAVEGQEVSSIASLENLSDLAIVGADYMAKGVVNFVDWSASMTREFGERITPRLSQIYDEARAMRKMHVMELAAEREIKKLERQIAMREPFSPGRKDVKPSDVLAARQKRIEELREIRRNIQDELQPPKVKEPKPETSFVEKRAAILEKQIDELRAKVESGETSSNKQSVGRPQVKELETLMQERDALREELNFMRKSERELESLREQILDKERRLSAGDLSTEGRAINRPSRMEVEVLKQKRDVLNKEIAKRRSEEAKSESYEERIQKKVSALNTKIAERRKMLDSGEFSSPGKMANRPEVEAIERAKQELYEINQQIAEARKAQKAGGNYVQTRSKALRKQIDELQAKISSGDLSVRGAKASRPQPEEIEILIRQKESLSRELNDLRSEKRSEFNASLEGYKERTNKLIAKWQDKIQSGDLEPAPKKEMLKMDLEASRLEAKLLELKEDADFLVRKKQYENATASEKVRLQALGLWDNTRNIMAGMEFSYVLRQGKTFAESHPIRAMAAQPEMLKALIANPTEAHAINLNIINDPAALDAKHYGLDFTSPDGRLTNQEEFLMSDRLAQKIPIASAGIRRFSMAGSAYLNRVRLEYWKILSKEISPDDVAGRRQIANWINVATGRSTLDVVRRNQAALGRIFFSASYWASRLQLASQAVKLAVPGTFTPAARVAIAKEYARAMLGHSVRLSLYASMLTLLGHKTSFETDPRSSEFGKLVVDGKTRIDTMAGLGQLVTFLSRSATRQTKTGSGKIEPISAQNKGRNNRLWSDVMVDYTRSKLHPGLSKFWTMMDNRTITGQKADMFKETAELIYPITWGDIYNSFEEQDIPTATALSIMAWYGDGINTYEKNQKKSKLPK